MIKRLLFSVFSLLLAHSSFAQPDLLWGGSTLLNGSQINYNETASMLDKQGSLHYVSKLTKITQIEVNHQLETISPGSYYFIRNEAHELISYFPLAASMIEHIQIDSKGNVCYLARTTFPVDIDPGTAVVTVGQNLSVNHFLIYLNKSGQLLWYKELVYPELNAFQNICFDFDSMGNLFFASQVRDTFKIDAQSVIDTVYDNFILGKINPNGNLLFLKKLSSKIPSQTFSFNANLQKIQVMEDGSFLFGAILDNRAFDFDPDPLNEVTPPLNFQGQALVYYNQDAQIIWHHFIEGSTDPVKNRLSFALNALMIGQDIYVQFSSYNFNFDILTSEGLKHFQSPFCTAFILKFSRQGSISWVRSFPVITEKAPPGFDAFVSAPMACKNLLNQLVFGLLFQYVVVDLDPGLNVEPYSSNNTECALMALDSSGQILWKRIVTKSHLRHISSNAVDSGFYTLGIASDSFKLSSGLDTFKLGNSGYSDVLLHWGPYHPRGNLNLDTLLCSGDSISIGIDDQRLGDRYLWSNGDSASHIYISNSGQYTLTITNSFRTDTGAFNIQVAPRPSLYIGPDSAFCDYVDYLIQAQSSASKFLWNTGDTTNSLQVNSDGTYSLLVHDSLSCSNADTVLIDLIKSPFRNLPNDTSICLNAITLDAGNKGANYLWNTGEKSQQITVTKDGLYQVVIANQFCTTNDSITIHFLSPDSCTTWLHVPNAFSPNSDGLNTHFFINSNGIVEFEIHIYNRWGAEIFSSTNPNFEWDGNYQGKPVPEGVYMYRIHANLESLAGNIDQKNLKGQITLLR